jgi:hypothetical protein
MIIDFSSIMIAEPAFQLSDEPKPMLVQAFCGRRVHEPPFAKQHSREQRASGSSFCTLKANNCRAANK